METLSIFNTAEQVQIQIDKSQFSEEALLRILKSLEMEVLAHKIHSDTKIEVLGEEITANWWKVNKKRFIA